MYAQQFAHAGMNTIVARDALEALAYAEDGDVAAVLIDIGLPGPSGLDLARELRLRRKTKDAVLVALSGLPPEVGDDAVFDAYFMKPCLPAVVAAEIRRRLAAPRGRLAS